MSAQLVNEDRKVFSFLGNDIEFKKKENGQGEIVVHDPIFRNLSIRHATKPYYCDLHLANGTVKHVDLGDEEDWGNIQQCDSDDCEDWENSIGWGNDEDGHIKIVKVTCDDYGEEVEIPLEVFKRDVEDMLLLYEI